MDKSIIKIKGKLKSICILKSKGPIYPFKNYYDIEYTWLKIYDLITKEPKK